MKFKSFSDVKSFFLDTKGLKQTILKNTFWLTLAEVLSKGLTYIVLVLVARHFDYATYGKFAFAFSFVTIFMIFSDIGFSTFTVCEISKDKSKTSRYLDNIIAIKTVLGLILLGIIFLATQFIEKDPVVVSLVYLLGVYSILNSFGVFFYSIFQANEKMEYETAGRVLQQSSLLILVMFFVFTNGSIITIGYSYIASIFLALIFYLIVIWRYFSKFFLKINLRYCLNIIKGSWAFGLVLIFTTLYHQIDTIMLGLIKGYSAVGFYNIAQWLPSGMLIFPLILSGALFPKMSYFHKFSKESLKRLYMKYFKYMSIAGIIMGFLVLLSADTFVSLFFGSKYAPSSLALKIYIWATALIFIDSAFIVLFNAAGKQASIAKILGFAVVLNVVLNFILINKYSYIGASISAVTSEFIVAAIMFFAFLKNYHSFFTDEHN